MNDSINTSVDAAFEHVQAHPSLLEQLYEPRHADDVAVYSFAQELCAKMARNRAKGRAGWETCPVPELWTRLKDHIEKGDPRDVALFAMMIWHNEGGADRS